MVSINIYRSTVPVNLYVVSVGYGGTMLPVSDYKYSYWAITMMLKLEGGEAQTVKVRDASAILTLRFSRIVWSVEDVYEAKMQHHWIIPGYDCVFWWEQLSLRGYGVKGLMLVNQSNVNKPEFDLASIGLKDLKILQKKILLLKLTEQSFIHIRLKICYCIQPYSICWLKIYIDVTRCTTEM